MSHSKTKKRNNKYHSLNLDFIIPIADRGLIHDAEKRQLVSRIFNMITEKEKSVLTLKSIGYDYTEIAEEIHVSPKIAESIMIKLKNRIIANFPEIAAAYGAEVSYAC